MVEIWRSDILFNVQIVLTKYAQIYEIGNVKAKTISIVRQHNHVKAGYQEEDLQQM